MKRPTIIVVLEKILCKLITAINNTCFLFFFIYIKKRDKNRKFTFATEEEVIDKGEDQRDALYGILQVAENSVPVHGKGDHYTRERVDQANFQKGATGYFDSQAVWYQSRWWIYSSPDEAHNAQDEGREEGSEEKS